MWPYCKNKIYDIGEAECPGRGAPTTGWYQDGELIIMRICRNCRKVNLAEDDIVSKSLLVANFKGC